MYQGNVMGSVRGGLAAAVPGDLRGLEYVHTKYGVSLHYGMEILANNQRLYHGKRWLIQLFMLQDMVSQVPCNYS